MIEEMDDNGSYAFSGDNYMRYLGFHKGKFWKDLKESIKLLAINS